MTTFDKSTLEASSRFVAAAGLEIDEFSGTRVVGHIDLDENHHTPWGVVHGGVYATAVGVGGEHRCQPRRGRP